MKATKRNTDKVFAELARKAQREQQRRNEQAAFESIRDKSPKIIKGKKTLYKPLCHDSYLTERQLKSYFRKLITRTF